MTGIEKLGEINCVSEFICLIKKLYDEKLNFPINKAHRYFFFRGHRDCSWILKPSVFRDEGFSEKDIILDIKQFSPILNLNYDFIKDLPQVLVDLQHAGIPTRILDWTIQPLTALFFAVTGANCECGKGKVWIFNPWDYNKILRYECPQTHDINLLARAMISYGWSEFEIKEVLKNQYGYDVELIKNLDKPMAYVGGSTNNRKNAQHGCFTIFGTEQKSLDEFCDPSQLTYIVVNNQKEILNDLNKLCINDFSMFPDFYGAKEQFNKYKSLFKF